MRNSKQLHISQRPASQHSMARKASLSPSTLASCSSCPLPPILAYKTWPCGSGGRTFHSLVAPRPCPTFRLFTSCCDGAVLGPPAVGDCWLGRGGMGASQGAAGLRGGLSWLQRPLESEPRDKSGLVSPGSQVWAGGGGTRHSRHTYCSSTFPGPAGVQMLVRAGFTSN